MHSSPLKRRWKRCAPSRGRWRGEYTAGASLMYSHARVRHLSPARGGASMTLDRITVSVIQHRLESIVQEMGEAMLRTAYSQILNSSRDFSTAVFDGDGRLAAQAEHVPIHVGALPMAVKSVADYFAGRIRPGDMFLLNDPYHGGNHLPDLTALLPVFVGERLAFWSINRAHQSDIGGATHGAYNPGATEIWQEGIRIPPLKLYDAGCIRGWKDGVYRGVSVLDDDGHGIEDIALRATVSKKGDSLIVDLTECDPQVIGFVNSSYPNTVSAVHMALAYLLDPRIPKNEGTFRPVEIKAKQGTIVWPYPPAPVTLATNHCAQEIAEAVIKALAAACPERALAGWSRRFRIAISGKNPRTQRPFIWHLFHARGGGGASSAGAGWETAGEGQAAGGIKFGSVEVAEARFPLFFERHEFRPDSQGDGQFRGGVGSVLRLRMETTEPARGNTAGDGVRHPSYGILGGKDGLPHRYVMVSKGKRRVLKTKEVGIPIPPGAVFDIVSAGGGGWGKPSRRDPAARAADLENGFVTRKNGHGARRRPRGGR